MYYLYYFGAFVLSKVHNDLFGYLGTSGIFPPNVYTVHQ